MWEDDGIWKLINEQYVLVRLYVDKRKSVPLEVVSIFDKEGNKKGTREIETKADQWMTLQEQTFMKNTQPLHVILMPCDESEVCDEKLLGPVLAYKDANDVDYYTEWLKEGLKNYKEYSETPIKDSIEQPELELEPIPELELEPIPEPELDPIPEPELESIPESELESIPEPEPMFIIDGKHYRNEKEARQILEKTPQTQLSYEERVFVKNIKAPQAQNND